MNFNAEIKYSHSFASDNNSGVHPEIMQALTDAASSHVIAYGDDPYTLEAKQIFLKYFGERGFFLHIGQ